MNAHQVPAGAVQFLQPAGLHQNDAYTNVIVVTGAVKTLYIGAQGALDTAGHLVGQGDIGAQTEQVMNNLQTALSAAGAGLEHVIKWTIYIAQGQPLQAAFAAGMRAWGDHPHLPANTVLVVAALVPADFLIAIEAIAVIPEYHEREARAMVGGISDGRSSVTHIE